ncbi:trihelix transcription factor GTL2 [Prunus yedoensis var. nudiflora]|uniref:Trihelix transcription factor GTL2 n=1 Tax=Prunus yedoensis var. nudiflora TaxID=2094558 RepID=A0A314YZ73_PRUYE|nr:trihelix transcription factor GTL2 [Prunus yedoensis var. nudiflora]
MDNWFPEFTWEHVSRKLAELGFKRSAEKCKEKFEEESRYFNNINFTKNYRFLSDLEELCHGGDDQNPDQAAAGAKNKNQQKVEKPSNNEGDEDNRCQILDEDSTRNETVVGSKEFDDQDKEKEVVERTKCNVVRKRKRQRRFEMLKGFCEDIVNRMMAQQEEMHSKLLEDMVKRSEEKLAREEAWKKQEMDRMNKELEIMAHEQAISEPSPDHDHHTNSSSLINQARNPNHLTCRQEKEPASSTIIQKSGTSSHTPNNPSTPTSLTETLAPQSPSSNTLAPTPTIPKVPIPPENPSSDHLNTQNPTSNDDKQDLGKRWPRDEVLALINLRCSLFNNGSADQDKDGVVKAPLWERISQGMLEKGYKRSAKRCKEKWENINKYFRKTKDVNKKRSLDSRTCPHTCTTF